MLWKSALSYIISATHVQIRTHQTRQSWWLFRPGFNNIDPLPPFRWSFGSFLEDSLFSQIIILFLVYSHIWSSHVTAIFSFKLDIQYIFYSKLVDCIFFKIDEQHVYFMKSRGHLVVGKETFKIPATFWKSPRFSLTSPFSLLKEKLSHLILTK